jgi:hypothetical protein
MSQRPAKHQRTNTAGKSVPVGQEKARENRQTPAKASHIGQGAQSMQAVDPHAQDQHESIPFCSGHSRPIWGPWS